MIKLFEYDNLRIPDYALSYLVNGDNSGLEPEDIQAIDSYMAKYYKQADDNQTHVIFAINDSESESYFTGQPAFGLACNVYDCTVLIVK